MGGNRNLCCPHGAASSCRVALEDCWARTGRRAGFLPRWLGPVDRIPRSTRSPITADSSVPLPADLHALYSCRSPIRFQILRSRFGRHAVRGGGRGLVRDQCRGSVPGAACLGQRPGTSGAGRGKRRIFAEPVDAASLGPLLALFRLSATAWCATASACAAPPTSPLLWPVRRETPGNSGFCFFTRYCL